ncbi:unnamed protein product [Peronospora effusa]|nr:unnamed protein product [Peronospora effusa]
MNLERWNFFMQTFDETGRYNFEDKLKETLKAFCGNDDRATLFLKRLVILRGRTRRNQLKWLREMKDPKQVYKDMKVDDKENRFNEDNLANWSKYVDAYNDLYLQSKETLRSYFSGLDEALIEKILRGRKNYAQMGPKKQMLDEILESWAAKKPPFLLLRRKESDTIEEFYKFKDALWPKNPLKRKSESPSDDARDRQRPRGE